MVFVPYASTPFLHTILVCHEQAPTYSHKFMCCTDAVSVLAQTYSIKRKYKGRPAVPDNRWWTFAYLCRDVQLDM